MFLSVAYYPDHWPEKEWAKDAKNIKACNINGVRIGEFAWSRMEPKEGEFNFDWFDRAIETLGNEGLKVIIGTPTATPPSWLIHKHPEILPVDGMGVQMKNGVRKYYCHTNPIYRKYAQKIAGKLAERYGNNPHVFGWQIDNEFGDHDTVRCYCDACRNGFIEWCKAQYENDLGKLNEAWGTVFWSQTYSEWDEIDLPYPRRPIGLNPSHLLAYYRFASDQVIEFSNLQVRELRKHISTDQKITTNIIATFWEIDFQKLAKELDFISWDCYTIIDAMSPIRYPDDGPPPPIAFPPRPAMYSLVHDLMRGFKHKPFWVMETAGQDRLVAYHTLAHGGDGMSMFRWRGSRFGAEQGLGGFEYHGMFSDRFHETKKIGEELQALSKEITDQEIKPNIALLYSFDMGWAYDIAHVYPRSVWVDGIGYWRLLEEYYTAFWEKNIPVEPVCVDDDWEKYSLLVIPTLYITNPEINQKIEAYIKAGGFVIMGPASASKDWDNVYFEELPPGDDLRDVFGCDFLGGNGFSLAFFGGNEIQMAPDSPFNPEKKYSLETNSTKGLGFFQSNRPTEKMRIIDSEELAQFSNGQTASTIKSYGKGKIINLGFSPTKEFWDDLVGWLQKAGVVQEYLNTPEGVEVVTQRGKKSDYLFLVNHTIFPQSVEIKGAFQDVITGQECDADIVIQPQHTVILKSE